MVIENPLPPFWEWLPSAALWWVVICAVLGGGWLLLVWLTAIARRGPAVGSRWLLGTVGTGLVDLVRLSPRRVAALAWLSVRESIRGRVFVVFVVFAVILSYLGWFLPRDVNPAELYLDHVLSWTSFLVLVMALFLSVFSLPNDFKNRTIYTIVTKPVRPTEIVLGRLAGFTLVGTVLLAAMGLVSYVFVGRMLNHRHEVSTADVKFLGLPPVGARFDETTIVEQGRLALADDHVHRYSISASGVGYSETAAGHWHSVARDVTPKIRYAKSEPGNSATVHLYFSEPMDPVRAASAASYTPSAGLAIRGVELADDQRHVTLTLSAPATIGATTIKVDDALPSRIGRALTSAEPVVVGDRDLPADMSVYAVGGPEGLFQARVPIRGELQFYDRTGEPAARGISVGNEWDYRRFIQGATLAAAVWRFRGVDPETVGEQLPFEITIRVFRSHKGEIDEAIRGSLVLRNPKTGLKSNPRTFLAKDAQIDQQYFPRKLQATDERGRVIDVDLFDDLVADGEIEVVVQCLEPWQFFGVAAADAYLQAREGSFALNFIKGHLGIWLQMALVIAYGVMFSTFLSGPVAMLATLAALVVGFFRQFVLDVTIGQRAAELGQTQKVYGGGPLEQAYRLFKQMNIVEELPLGFTRDFIKAIDYVLTWLMTAMASVLPDFGDFQHVKYVASGFNVPGLLTATSLMTALGYWLPVFLVACFILKTREVAR